MYVNTITLKLKPNNDHYPLVVVGNVHYHNIIQISFDDREKMTTSTGI